MATAHLNLAPSGTAQLNPAPSGGVPFSTALAHTWYLTGRKLHALVRQPWVLAFSVVQPVIWLFLFGQLFRKVIDIPGFSFGGTYMDYLVPGASEMPQTKIEHLSLPSPITRYGIKGMGEGGAIPPPASICNAVNDALRRLGVSINETPMTPDRIVRALIDADAGKAGA